ncbi:MAG TPA: hypothetical protein VMX97_17325 [Hyphomicrobiaceae bacterium]|nr:hypothetical protein [Hyphomicrobiaceae bacterium]
MVAYVTEGTLLKRGNAASPEIFGAITQLTSIDTAGFARGLIDVTNLASGAREYKPAMEDGTEMSCEGQYAPGDAQHVGLRTDLNAGTTRNFQLILQTSPVETWNFAGLVTAWSTGAAVDGIYPLRFTIKPTATITIT